MYIKTKNWQQYQAPLVASWAVKYVCKVIEACNVAMHSSSWLTKAKYSIKGVYNQLKTQAEKTQWARYVSNRPYIPKHRFTLWLLLLDKLKTRDKCSNMALAPITFVPFVALLWRLVVASILIVLTVRVS